MGARKFQDLECWKLSNAIRRDVIARCQLSGFNDHAWLKSQLVRCASSACANTAEGFGRFNPRDFARFLAVARGSLDELSDHLETASLLGLLHRAEVNRIGTDISRAKAAMSSLIRYLRAASPPDTKR